LKEVLSGAPGLAGLLTQARRVEQYDEIARRLIEEPLKQHCRVAALRGETLVLLTDSPVWAARLRFEAPALLKRLALIPAFRGVREIKVKVGARRFDGC
jgi:hypothetical protein